MIDYESIRKLSNEELKQRYGVGSPELTKHLFGEFDKKMFGGIKTKREKQGIVIAEMARLDKMLRDFNISAIEKTMLAILKKEGRSGLLKTLKEEKTVFESLLPKEKLNEIFTRCTKKK
jgi:hypothetical protein